jgi:sterol desaturase/sphingolipid hydroxylase (fatty acid hydroxylase superfamily)
LSNDIILRLTELLYSAAAAAGVFAACFVLFYLLERRAGGDLGRYRTRHFWNDVAYAMFYRGGFYQVLIGAVAVTAFQPRLSFLQLDLFNGWPLPARAVAFWITSDFLGYWMHRLQHRVPFLWAFHSVHHAQERMTFLTSYRIHPIEQLIASLVLFVPLLVIGLPTESWLPLVAALTVLEFAQHSDLPWRFGPLYRVLVSPAFHAIHHSVDRRHYDKHFGKILSTWDVIFGTAVPDAERPRRYGIEGLRIPESLTQQLVFPFRLVWNNYQQPDVSEPRAAAAPSVIGAPPEAVLELLKNAGATIECELQ